MTEPLSPKKKTTKRRAKKSPVSPPSQIEEEPVDLVPEPKPEPQKPAFARVTVVRDNGGSIMYTGAQNKIEQVEGGFNIDGNFVPSKKVLYVRAS